MNRSSGDAGGGRIRLLVANGAASAGTTLCMVLAVSGCNASRDTFPPAVTTEQPGQTGEPEVPTTEQRRHIRKPEVSTNERAAQVGGDLLPTIRADPVPSTRPDVDETIGLPEPATIPLEPGGTLPEPKQPEPKPSPEPLPEPSPTTPREPNPTSPAPSQNPPPPEVTR